MGLVHDHYQRFITLFGPPDQRFLEKTLCPGRREWRFLAQMAQQLPIEVPRLHIGLAQVDNLEEHRVDGLRARWRMSVLLPLPTSPVSTPKYRCSTIKRNRARASL
jgi:hypothetical protein